MYRYMQYYNLKVIPNKLPEQWQNQMKLTLILQKYNEWDLTNNFMVVNVQHLGNKLRKTLFTNCDFLKVFVSIYSQGDGGGVAWHTPKAAKPICKLTEINNVIDWHNSVFF